ncbi:hypothetical protein [Pseudomonas sp. OTU750018]|uniref:hypothetical protein n=1 Tax=Pseudomonas sp. OTU750018 TaxID=2709708 RepID=UPI0014248C5D|nr:hypothetical protein [Pseudomonas sp. OTU750018]
MNPIAEQALARAMAKGAVPVPATAVQPAAPINPVPVAVQAEVVGHFDRLGFLEGRRHATEIVRSAGHSLNHQKGRLDVLDKLRRCAVGKPPSFARGVSEILELMEREVGHG